MKKKRTISSLKGGLRLSHRTPSQLFRHGSSNKSRSENAWMDERKRCHNTAENGQKKPAFKKKADRAGAHLSNCQAHARTMMTAVTHTTTNGPSTISDGDTRKRCNVHANNSVTGDTLVIEKKSSLQSHDHETRDFANPSQANQIG